MKGIDDSAFWSGSYLLDGILNRDEDSRDTVSIHARLQPPQATEPLMVEVSGNRTNLPEVANRLVEMLMLTLARGSAASEWKPAEEAEHYFQEAKWAMKWGLWKEGQAASESSWALGHQHREVAELRIRLYQKEAIPDWPGYARVAPTRENSSPDRTKLFPAIRALQLYESSFRMFLGTDAKPDLVWLDLGLHLLCTTSYLLDQFYLFPENWLGCEDQLGELRRSARQVVRLLKDHPAYAETTVPPEFGSKWQWSDGGPISVPYGKCDLIVVLAARGACWCDTPVQALEYYRHIVRDGALHRVRKYIAHTTVMGWTDHERERCPTVWRAYVNELCTSTNLRLMVEGYFLAFADSWPNFGYIESEKRLLELIEDNLSTLDSAGLTQGLMNDIEWVLAGWPYAFPDRSTVEERGRFYYAWKGQILNMREEEQAKLEWQRRLAHINGMKDYLRTNLQFRYDEFDRLFMTTSYSESEALEFIPLVKEYKRRVIEGQNLNPTSYSGPWHRVTNTINNLELKLQAASIGAPAKPVQTLPTAQPDSTPQTVGLLTNRVHVTRFWEMPYSLFDYSFSITPPTAIGNCCFRDGKLWMQVVNKVVHGLRKAVIFGIDLTSLTAEIIELPLHKTTLDLPDGKQDSYCTGDSYEVIDDSLYFILEDRLKRYALKRKVWEDMHIQVEPRARLKVLDGRLFVETSTSIQEIDLSDHSTKVLASTRRRPAVSTLDSFPNLDHSSLFIGPGRSLCALVNTNIFTWNNEFHDWSSLASFPEPHTMALISTSDMGLVFPHFNPGFEMEWFLLPANGSALELAFKQPLSKGRNASMASPSRPIESPSAQPLWTLSKSLNMDVSAAVFDGSSLWMFTGDLGMTSANAGSSFICVRDGRHADLLRFQRGRAEGEVIPLWFEFKSDLIPYETLQKFLRSSTRTPAGYVQTRNPGPVSFVSTPKGLVVTAQYLPGLWFIPHEDIDARTNSLSSEMVLFTAAESGDLPTVQFMLSQGVSIEARNFLGWTPLILAAKAGKLPVVRFLVSKGADVNARSTSAIGSTVLCFATETNNVEVLKTLLDHGADVNMPSRNGTTPLFTAAVDGQVEHVKLFLQHGANVDEFGFKDEKGTTYTPLMGAAIKGHVEVMELLLAKGANLEKKNNQGFTALMEVSKSVFSEAVKALIARGADVNAQGPEGHTALILACYHRRPENAKLLLAAGADTYARAEATAGSANGGFDATHFADRESLKLILEARKRRQQGIVP